MTQQTLTRKAFYSLAHECRDYAMHLANHDQNLVDGQLCREYNQFRARVQSYDRLAKPLARMRPARLITRKTLVLVSVPVWLLLLLLAPSFLDRGIYLGAASVFTMLLLGVILIPPRIYGTSVEAIEGRVLLVVRALQDMLSAGEMEFTEAAYFAVRDVLKEAADELRQQVYLNRVAGWRRR